VTRAVPHGGGKDGDRTGHRNAYKQPPSRDREQYACSYCRAIEALAHHKIEIDEGKEGWDPRSQATG